VYKRQTYDIIGYGSNDEINLLLQKIEDYKLANKVTFHGRKYLNELIPFFDKCNIGVSYIPITSYYNLQPATKTFEYLLSGMACIATNTLMNRHVVDKSNGVLCYDTSDSFAKALADISLELDTFNSSSISSSCSQWSWENICNYYFLPLLKN
jgi:glycosyltransferase involved in cell wall biosynthesis